MDSALSFIFLGIVAGAVSGLIGIGGGVIVVPALVFIFGFSQHMAQGTTLALLVPPIGLLAAWTYWKQGAIDIRAAVFICIGFVIGSLIGARTANNISNVALERIFGFIMFLLSIKMMFA